MSNWLSYNSRITRYSDAGFTLDLSLLDIDDAFFSEMQPKIDRAFTDMHALEAGEIANPDEARMVGHYWLRNADLAPTPEIKSQITEPIAALKEFAENIRTRSLAPKGGGRFENLLIIGIGGSALGPQFVYNALGANSKLDTYFFDNTDPAGIDTTLAAIAPSLNKTLVLVVSKSGGTAETRNGMLEAQEFFESHKLDFAKHAVAITGQGSKLYNYATDNNWLTIFPMEDWVGGRSSVMSTVGLVPAALQGIDIDSFLAGAKQMDTFTRNTDTTNNAAMQLALGWYHAGNGKGEKDMVVLPYKDSLSLFSKYLQQLVMESLGKELDLDGNVVNQGIAVYGNKGSTDQHAYVQQLRDGVKNFFATFIEVRKGRNGASIEVEDDNTTADYLQGFLRGTRKALYESGRKSITISINEVTPHSLGMLIALFERAVSFYASLVNINAYHQPGVEAGKKAATSFLEVLNEVRGALTGWEKTAADIAEATDNDPEDVYHALIHLAANGEATQSEGSSPAEDSFTI